MKWTQEQEAAINIRNTDTLVSAAAGSGKTAVLVERVIRRITDPENPVDIDKLLVVTFTNAAAAQMKEKISKALALAIEQNPSDRRLRNQLILLGSAEINTVHAFCMNVIKNNFQKTELPYDFSIAMEVERKLLMEEALDETFNEFYEDEEKCADFERFTDSFSKNDDTSAAELILRLYEFLRSMPFYREWLENKVSELRFDNPDDTVWGEYLKDYAINILDCVHTMNRCLCDFLKENGEKYGVDVYLDAVASDADIIKDFKLAVNDGFQKAFEYSENLKFPAIGRKNADTDPECAEFVKSVRELIKKSVEELSEDIFYQDTDEIAVIAKNTVSSLVIITDVIKTFEDKFNEKKQKRALVDFSDLEHKCVDILCSFDDGKIRPSETALKLRERYSEVFVDEYQDINSLQELIISMIARQGTRFLVGDVKQSIYGFRNSNPQLFLEKYNTYSKDEGDSTRRLLLSKNFRSCDHILQFVNFVFSDLMCASVGGLDYGDDEKLYFGEGYSFSDSTDVYVFDRSALDDGLDKDTREAYLCASKIKEMVDSGYKIEENGIFRPVSYGDFTVILRTVKKYTDVYRSAFREYGIPLYIEKGSSYFDIPSVKLMISLLKIIDNPRQDVHVIAVLRSHIFAFDDDMLVDVRCMDKNADFYTCLKLAADAGNISAQTFFDRLKRWRSIADTASVRYLTELLLDECDMFAVFPENADKLRALSDWAERYAKTSYKGLFRFISYLQRQIDENEDIGGNTVGSADVVTLMSIHKSKGLENNIVILANTGTAFNLSDIYDRIIFDSKLGIASDYADTEHKILYASLPKLAAHRKIVSDCIAEELRLLYVALTRAKCKLVIVGSLNRIDKRTEAIRARSVCKNDKGFSEFSALKTRNHLEWILSGLMSHPSAKEFFGNTFGMTETKECDFDVNIVLNPEITPPNTDEKHEITEISADSNFDEVRRILEYRYPYETAVKIPSKLSVSEIKSRYYTEFTEDGTVFYPRAIDSSVQLVPEPSFMSETGNISPAALGTAYHSILQYIDFDTKDEISDILQNLCEQGIIADAERKAVDKNVVKSFLGSELCDALKSADAVYKEYSFVIPFDSSKLFEGEPETVMVQGIIDCVYVKDGELYVVDYKSDSYSSAVEIADRYRTQLAVYSEAVLRKFGKRPKKCMLYMLRTASVIEA